MGWLCGIERCLLKRLPFLCTPHPLFSAVNCRRQCHRIYMYLLERGCICLSLSERMICPSLENTGYAQTAGKWEHEFSSNSEPLLRVTLRCAESLSPPVITLETAGRAEKNPTCLSKHFSLCNCSTYIHRITGLILLYNQCSLFPLIVSLLNLFCLCSHFGYTNVCHANQAICVQGNCI